jgi:hypothetical protein
MSAKTESEKQQVYLDEKEQITTPVSESLHSEDHERTNGGDTAFANAPWKYKIIALVTALLFPREYTLLLKICLFMLFNHLMSFDGSFFY